MPRSPFPTPTAVALAVLASLLVAAVPASGDENSLNVVLIVPDRPYAFGETVPVRVRVFDRGAPRDVDALTILVGPLASDTNRAVSWTRTDVGAYASQFDLDVEDVNPERRFRVQAVAGVGDYTDDDDVRRVATISHHASVTVTPRTVSPGGGVTALITFRDAAGGFVTPDLLDVSAVLRSGPSFDFAKLSAVQQGTGQYAASYTLKPFIDQDAVVQIVANAKFGALPVSAVGLATVSFEDRLEVWYRAVAPAEAAFELWVADEAGWPVPNAVLKVAYPYFHQGTGQIERRWETRTTNASGTAAFTLPGAVFPIAIEGIAEADGRIQRFSGTIFLPSSGPPSGFIAVRRDILPPLGPAGTTVAHNYTAYWNRESLPSARIHFYAHTDTAFVAFGTVVADDAGHFAIALPVQTQLVWIDFQAEVDGTWHKSVDALVPYLPLTAAYDDVYIGSTTTVTASLPPTAPSLATVAFLPVDASAYAAYPSEAAWQKWSGVSPAQTLGDVTDGELTATVNIPRFLPKGQDYLLAMFAYPEAAFGEPIHLQWWMLRIGNVAPDVSADLSSRTILEGETVSVSASASVDRDGAVEAYAIDWGDGTATDWSDSPEFEHAYGTPGVYTITVQARDDSGDMAATSVSLRVESLSARAWQEASPLLVLGGTMAAVLAVLGFLRRQKRLNP